MQQPVPEIDSAAPPSVLSTVVRALGGIGLGVTIAILAAWWLDVKPDELIASIRSVPAWAVITAASSGFVVIAFQTLRWWLVMKPLLPVRYLEAYRVNLAVAMLNALIPARGGDLLRIGYFGRRTGISRATILGREIVDRWLDMWGWFPTFLLVCLIGSPPVQLLQWLGGFGALIAAWAIVMFVLAKRGYRPREGSRLGKIWAALKSGMDAFRSRRTVWIMLLIAPLSWTWETIVLSQIGAAFGLDLTLVMAFTVLMAFNLATAVPSPGAVGTVESGGMVALHIIFGFDRSKALAFMLVYHMAQLLPSMLAGAIVLATGGKELKMRAPVSSREEVADAAPAA